jgi:hypothetical protein
MARTFARREGGSDVKKVAHSGLRVAAAMAVSALALSVSACGNFKEAIGATKQAPDEFAIQTRAPLAVPPDFSLKTPTPGAPRPQDADVSVRARQALLGNAPSRPATEGETALLANAGTDKADPAIRSNLMTEQRQRRSEAARYSYADAVLFWQSSPADQGQPLDAAEESKRLNESQVVNAETTTGAAPAAPAEEPKEGDKPVIEKDDKSGGWFSGWF